jgi:hypothetical protein
MAYFHNMIGLLTEIVGSPTPSAIPLVPSRLIPNDATPNPVVPQEWHFRQSIDYSVSLNYGVLNYAVNQKEELLFGIYRMGKNSIEKGSRDNWSLSPKWIDSLNNVYRKEQRATRPGEGGTAQRVDTVPAKYFKTVFSDPTLRDARGYILSASQPDFPAAVRFVNALIGAGIQVQKATQDFTVKEKKYPAGSYVVKTAQAFRPQLMDMFEPQDHPNDFAYPGGPPVRPYDAAGWTLAYTMGVQFDRLQDDFSGPFEKLPYGQWQMPAASLPAAASGYVLDARSNAAFLPVNDLLKAGVPVYRIRQSPAAGSFYVPSSAKAKEVLQQAVAAAGVNVTTATKPSSLQKVAPLRIALWDQYGGSMASGWVRWLMEQYHFQSTVVYPKEIDAGDLKKKYDVLVFVGGAIAAPGTNVPSRMPKPGDVPAEWRERLGRITADTSIPQLKKFLAGGGRVVTIGSSTSLAYHLGLPVRNALVEMTANGERPLPGEKFYIPGSVLRMSVDSTQPAASGAGSEVDVYFDASPVFKLAPEAVAQGTIKPIGWFASDKTLRSGWAWGQAYLKDGIAAFWAPVGKGMFYAFGPEITFRGQTHGTFRFLFNTLYE